MAAFRNESTETIVQRAARLGVPVIPAKKSLPVVDANPTIGVCGACGIEIKKIMHIACRRTDCPLNSGASL